jgi:[acyl-carrier-protein] S-malonyltransferase
LTRLALLFAGQGSQHPGMLSWLEHEPAAAPMLARLGERLGHEWRLRLADPSWANANSSAQVLITATSLAAWAVLAARAPRIVAIAGYSVGELAAFAAAGVFDAETAVSLASTRAQAMDRCAASGEPGGLLSISDLSAEAMQSLCERHALSVAIRLGPRRFIVGGARSSLARAADDPRLNGIETTLLRVNVASHTPAMHAAAESFRRDIDAMPWSRPVAPLITGFDGASALAIDDLKHALSRQIESTVRWDDCLQAVAERQPDRVIEIGPGNALARMWQSAWPAIPARSVDDFASADAVLDWIHAG